MTGHVSPNCPIAQLPNHLITLLPVYLITLLLSGCVTMTDPEASQLYNTDPVATVRDGSPVGQSFTSRRAGLNGIQLWLQPEPGGASQAGTLAAEVYTGTSDNPVYQAQVPIPQAANSRPFLLAIPAQAGPPGQRYYLELRVAGGAVQVLGRAEDAYPDGEAYARGASLEADLSFQLTYDWGLAALVEDLRRALGDLPLAIPLGLVLWLPGRVCLALLALDQDRDWGERTALSAGFSLAILPVLMTWTSLAGLRWSRAGLWAGLALLAGIYLWKILGPIPPSLERKGRKKERGLLFSPPSFLGKGGWGGIGLFAIFLFCLFIRLVMARDLAAPPWVDSVHHAMLAALIQENGAFPASYAPYVNIETASYHPGFHTGLAAFAWLSGLDLIDGLLVYGQALNALAAVFGVYLFTVALTNDRTAGLFAALIAGFLTPMPAYYTSWGRYTQLAGMLILPAAGALVFEILAGRKAGRLRTVFGTGILIAGLLLTHYRVAAFLALLAAAALPFALFQVRKIYPRVRVYTVQRQEVWRRYNLSRFQSVRLQKAQPGPRRAGLLESQETLRQHYRSARPLLVLREKYWRHHWSRNSHPFRLGRRLLRPRSTYRLEVQGSVLPNLGRLVAAGGLAILLTLPWWPPLVATLLLPRLGYRPGGEPFSDFSWAYLTTAYGRQTLFLAGLGTLWGLAERRGFPLLLALWSAFLFALANLHALNLPGAGFVNNTSVAILLYLPIATVGGYFLSRLVSAGMRPLSHRWQLAYRLLAVSAAAGLALAGARALLPLLNPATVLFRQADRPAMHWISQNVPPGEMVMINPFSWGYGLYAGRDGGYWIVPAAGRPTLPPPVLAGFSNDPEPIQEMTDFVRRALDAAGQPQVLAALLDASQIRYIYLGARGGAFSAARLMESGLFRPVYASQGTWVFVRNFP